MNSLSWRSEPPPRVRLAVDRIPREHIEAIAFVRKAEELASAYILVSWNFKHIVNLKRIHAYNAVNIKKEYPLLEIRTPREVAHGE